MSIFNKVSEFCYGRPKKLASISTRGERGQYGEDLAADYCKRTLGFQVIIRNWRCKKYELDIVCLDSGVLVFVKCALERRAHWLVVVIDRIKAVYNEARRLVNQLQNPPKHVRLM